MSVPLDSLLSDSDSAASVVDFATLQDVLLSDASEEENVTDVPSPSKPTAAEPQSSSPPPSLPATPPTETPLSPTHSRTTLSTEPETPPSEDYEYHRKTLSKCLDTGIIDYFDLNVTSQFMPDFLSFFTKRLAPVPVTSVSPDLDKRRSQASIVGKLNLTNVFDFLQQPALESFGSPTCMSSIGIGSHEDLCLSVVGTSGGRVIVLTRDADSSGQIDTSSLKLGYAGVLPYKFSRKFVARSHSIVSVHCSVTHTTSTAHPNPLLFSVLVAAGFTNGNVCIWEFPITNRGQGGNINLNIGGAVLLKTVEIPSITKTSQDLPADLLSKAESKTTRTSDLSATFVHVVDSCDGVHKVVAAWNTGAVALISLTKSLLTVGVDLALLIPPNESTAPTQIIQVVSAPAILPHRPSAVAALLFSSQLVLLALSPQPGVISAVTLDKLFRSIDFNLDFEDFPAMTLSLEPFSTLNSDNPAGIRRNPIPRISITINNFLLTLSVIAHEQIDEDKPKTLGRFAIEQTLEIVPAEGNRSYTFKAQAWPSINHILVMTQNFAVFPVKLSSSASVLKELQGKKFKSELVSICAEELFSLANLSVLAQTFPISRPNRKTETVTSFNQSISIDGHPHHTINDVPPSVVVLGQDSISTLHFRPSKARAEEMLVLGMYYDALALMTSDDVYKDVTSDFDSPALIVGAIKEVSNIKFSSKSNLLSVLAYIIDGALKLGCVDTLFALDFSIFSSKFRKSWYQSIESLLLTLPCPIPTSTMPPVNLIKDILNYIIKSESKDGNEEGVIDRGTLFIQGVLDFLLYSAKKVDKCQLDMMISFCSQLANHSVVPEIFTLAHYSVFCTISELYRLSDDTSSHSEAFHRGLDLIFSSTEVSFFTSLISRIYWNLFPSPLNYSITTEIATSYLLSFVNWMVSTSIGRSSFGKLFSCNFSGTFTLILNGLIRTSVDHNQFLSVLIDNLIGSSVFPLLGSLDSCAYPDEVCNLLEFFAIDFISKNSVFCPSKDKPLPIRPIIRVLTHLTSSGPSFDCQSLSVPMSSPFKSIVLSTIARKFRLDYQNSFRITLSDLQSLITMAINNDLFPAAVFLSSITSPVDGLKLIQTKLNASVNLLPFTVQDPPSKSLSGASYLVECLFNDSQSSLTKQEFLKFEESVVSTIPILAQLNPTSTAFLAGARLQKYIGRIIPTLQSQPYLLFSLLDALDKRCSLPGDALDSFIALLCEFAPERALLSLKAKQMIGINLNKALEAAEKFGVVDVSAYVLERTGDVGGALDLRLDQLTNALNELETDQSNDVLTRVKCYFQEAFDICLRNITAQESVASFFGEVSDPLYDHFLVIFLQHKIWKTVAIKPENVSKFSKILGDLLSQSIGVDVGADSILRKMIENCPDFPLILIRRTLSNLLDLLSFNASMSNAAVRAVSGDSTIMSNNLVSVIKQGVFSSTVETCFDCGNVLKTGLDGGILTYLCGHSYHHDCVKGRTSKSCTLCFPRKQKVIS
ncbi:hypothetical protein P9112_003079 [Eukaryota sp. TZLM1-RC]